MFVHYVGFSHIYDGWASLTQTRPVTPGSTEEQARRKEQLTRRQKGKRRRQNKRKADSNGIIRI